MSYPFAAFLAGWLAERGFDRRYLTSVLAMAAGLGVIFACGVAWLAWFAAPAPTGLSNALRAGLYPFMLADIVKLLARRDGATAPGRSGSCTVARGS